MSHHEPEPLPRDDVEQVYLALEAAGEPLCMDELAALVPAYTESQVYWACGTMTMQGILGLIPERRSDRQATNSALEIKLPFAGYIGWESAK